MLERKTCSACGGGPWPPHRFYKSGVNKAGKARRDSRCKSCRRQFSQEHKELKPELYRQYDLRRRTPEFYAQQKAYVQTDRGRAARRRATRAWRVTHPELYEAQKRRAAAALQAKRAQQRLTTESRIANALGSAFAKD